MNTLRHGISKIRNSEKTTELPMDADGKGDRSKNPRIMERDSDSDSLKDQISEPSWFTPKR